MIEPSAGPSPVFDAAAAAEPGRRGRTAQSLAIALAGHAALIAAILTSLWANPPPPTASPHEIAIEAVTQDEAEAATAPSPAATPPSGQAQAANGRIEKPPEETDAPQEARRRGAQSAAREAQAAAPQPFGALEHVADQPKAEPLPTFLSPQAYANPVRPRPRQDPANDNYRARVLGKVAAAMQDPDRPRPKALAVVGFRIDDKGGLVAAWLARPTGSPELDAEALDMVKRAAPFPPPPANADREFGAAVAFGGD